MRPTLLAPAAFARRSAELVRGTEHAALGDDGGDERGRCDVEGRVVDGRVARARSAVPADGTHLAAARSSMGIAAPDGSEGSMVENGAAT